MCQGGARKRPRSSTSSGSISHSSQRSRSALAVHQVTPEPSCASDSESEPAHVETSVESPASSWYSPLTSYAASPSRTVKRRKLSSSPPRTQTVLDGDQDPASASKGAETETHAMSAQRNEIVAAILTIASALGLTKETLHVCVDVLDRYLSLADATDPSRLETLSIACLWLAVKFIETPETIAKKAIKLILKRRRHSGNWTWHEIIRQEGEILRVLNFRLIGPTVLSLLQLRIHTDGAALLHEQRQLAFYFADLLLLKDRVNEFSKELLVDAIWFIVTGHQIADVQAPLLAPVVILFLGHRDNINPTHQAYKTWFALRCQYGPSLQAPWQLPYDPKCECRVCEHTLELAITTATVMPRPPPTANDSIGTTTTATKAASASLSASLDCVAARGA